MISKENQINNQNSLKYSIDPKSMDSLDFVRKMNKGFIKFFLNKSSINNFESFKLNIISELYDIKDKL